MYEIRDGTVDDAAFLAWVVLTAFRSHMPHGMWDLAIGDDEARTLEFLRHLVTTPKRHWAHFSTFLVAEVDGRPAAALAGYFADELDDPRLHAAIGEAHQRSGISDAGWPRAMTISNIGPEHADHAWVVENVATLPDYRRRGLSDALLKAILDRGRRWGATIAEIGVFIGNDAAQWLYERNGFAVVAERRDADFERAYGCPGARFLRQSL